MVKFSISIPGMQPMAVALQRIATGLTDLRPFFQEYFGPLWYRHIDTIYTVGGRPTWAPLSPKYAAWKEKHWPGLPVGTLSGATRESLTSSSDSFSVWRAGPTSLAVGTRVPYAKYLQQGTRRMPKRPPLQIDRAFMVDVGRQLQVFGHDVVKKNAPK